MGRIFDLRDLLKRWHEPLEVRQPVDLSAKPSARVVKPDKSLWLPGEVGAVLSWTVSDPKTGEIFEQKSKKAESYVIQFMQLLMCQMLMVTDVSPMTGVRDTSNTLREISHAAVNFSSVALASDATYGIQVGLSAAAPTISDYAIGSLIAHGVGLSQLQYGAVTFGMPSSDGVKSLFIVTRVFTNGSGNPITVQEIAEVVKANIALPLNNAQAIVPGYFLILHDTTGGIAVGNGQALTINYQHQAAV